MGNYPQYENTLALRRFLEKFPSPLKAADPGLIVQECAKWARHTCPAEPARALEDIGAELLVAFGPEEGWSLWMEVVGEITPPEAAEPPRPKRGFAPNWERHRGLVAAMREVKAAGGQPTEDLDAVARAIDEKGICPPVNYKSWADHVDRDRKGFSGKLRQARMMCLQYGFPIN